MVRMLNIFKDNKCLLCTFAASINLSSKVMLNDDISVFI